MSLLPPSLRDLHPEVYLVIACSLPASDVHSSLLRDRLRKHLDLLAPGWWQQMHASHRPDFRGQKVGTYSNFPSEKILTATQRFIG
jgi:hypothetical protein